MLNEHSKSSINKNLISEKDENLCPFFNIIGLLFVVYPKFFKYEKIMVDIECESNLTRGQSLFVTYDYLNYIEEIGDYLINK